MLSRKDYNAIAAILAGDLATCSSDGERRKVRGITLSLADYFRRDNPHFDRARFYDAVGVHGTTPST